MRCTKKSKKKLKGSNLNLDILIVKNSSFNPVFKSCHSCVDTGLSWSRTSNTPGHDTRHSEFVTHLLHYRTAGITLASVDASDVQFPGAEHGIRDVSRIRFFTVCVADHRHGGYLKSLRTTSLSRASPARDRHPLALGVISALFSKFRYASWLRVVVEIELGSELEQTNVILCRSVIVSRMNKRLFNLNFLLAAFSEAQIVFAGHDHDSIRTIREAVSSSENPLLVDDRTTAKMKSVVHLNAHLPWE